MNQKSSQTIGIIAQQLNMILSLMNDSLDLEALQRNRFETKASGFCPKQVIEFVVKLFQTQAKMQHTTINFVKEFEPLKDDQRFSFDRLLPSPDSIDESLDPKRKNEDLNSLPSFLFGDQIRLKQVLINVIKLGLRQVLHG